MKTLIRCTLVLTLALVVGPAAQAAGPVAAAPAVEAPQKALIDAPLVDTLCPGDQPAFADLEAGQNGEQYLGCADSRVACDDDADCISVCGRVDCLCWSGTYTCWFCPT